MNENERKVVVRRMLLLIAVACIIMGLYTFRLIFLQLVNGDDFKAKATNTTDYKLRSPLRAAISWTALASTSLPPAPVIMWC